MKIVRISAVWCTSCIITYAAWSNIKNKYSNIEFVELDYDTDDIDMYGIGDILPVTIFFKGEEVKRIEGEFKESDIERVIQDEKMDI